MNNLSIFQIIYIASVLILSLIVAIGLNIKIKHKEEIMTIKEWWNSGDNSESLFYNIEYYKVIIFSILVLIPYLNTIMSLFLLRKIMRAYLF